MPRRGAAARPFVRRATGRLFFSGRARARFALIAPLKSSYHSPSFPMGNFRRKKKKNIPARSA
jgi:hypothetical protein